jgi:hypothetical protein
MARYVGISYRKTLGGKMARKKIVSAVLAAGLLLLVAPTAATAAPSDMAAQTDRKATSLTSDQEAEIRASFDKYEVDAKQQDKLIKKIRSGQPLDAFTGAAPNVVEDRSTATQDETVERFADGSFKAQSVEKAATPQPGEITTMAVINNCSYSGGSGYAVYSNCTIAANWSGIINVAFVATYQHVNGGPSSILSVGNSTQNCAGVSCSSPSVWIGRQSSIGSTPAWAQAQSRVDAAWGSWEVWVQLQVVPSTAYAVQS